MPDARPRFSVVVFARESVATIAEALESLERQTRRADAEVIVADASEDGTADVVRERFPDVEHLRRPGGTMPTLKGAAIERARGELVAILDPADAAAPDWLEQAERAFDDPTVVAVGGTVELGGPPTAANRAGYLFEYGAFAPPCPAGPTDGDLPGNNVAYRASALKEECADLLPRGFYKPFFHARLRERDGRFVLRPEMRVRHLTCHTFWHFGVRRFHYGRCFGAMRLGTATARERALWRVFAPTLPLLLAQRQIRRAWSRESTRAMLPSAGLALVGVCTLWGLGEWLGYWAGAGRSCERVY